MKNIDFSKGSIHYSLKDDENIELGKGTAFIEDEPFPKIKMEDLRSSEITLNSRDPIDDFRELIILSYLKSCIDDYKPRIKRWKP